MKIRLMIFIAAICCMASCKEAAPQYANRAEMIAAQIHNPNSKYVVVACHRGDWRNYPENSIPAIESIIRMGFFHQLLMYRLVLFKFRIDYRI